MGLCVSLSPRRGPAAELCCLVGSRDSSQLQAGTPEAGGILAPMPTVHPASRAHAEGRAEPTVEPSSFRLCTLLRARPGCLGARPFSVDAVMGARWEALAKEAEGRGLPLRRAGQEAGLGLVTTPWTLGRTVASVLWWESGRRSSVDAPQPAGALPAEVPPRVPSTRPRVCSSWRWLSWALCGCCALSLPLSALFSLLAIFLFPVSGLAPAPAPAAVLAGPGRRGGVGALGSWLCCVTWSRKGYIVMASGSVSACWIWKRNFPLLFHRGPCFSREARCVVPVRAPWMRNWCPARSRPTLHRGCSPSPALPPSGQLSVLLPES